MFINTQSNLEILVANPHFNTILTARLIKAKDFFRKSCIPEEMTLTYLRKHRDSFLNEFLSAARETNGRNNTFIENQNNRAVQKKGYSRL